MSGLDINFLHNFEGITPLFSSFRHFWWEVQTYSDFSAIGMWPVSSTWELLGSSLWGVKFYSDVLWCESFWRWIVLSPQWSYYPRDICSPVLVLFLGLLFFLSGTHSIWMLDSLDQSLILFLFYHLFEILVALSGTYHWLYLLNLLGIYVFVILFKYTFFLIYFHTCSMWKFLSQVLNQATAVTTLNP